MRWSAMRLDGLGMRWSGNEASVGMKVAIAC